MPRGRSIWGPWNMQGPISMSLGEDRVLEEPAEHSEGSSCASDICGIYERFLTSFYNGVNSWSHKDQVITGLWVYCTQK